MRRSWLTMALGLSLTGCGAAGTSSGPTPTPPPGLASPPAPNACPAPVTTPAPNPTPVAEPSGSKVVQATVSIGADSAPSFAAAGFGSIWVAAYRGEFIDRVDPATNRVVATIPMPQIAGQPVGSGRLVTGPHGVWISVSQSTATGPATQPTELLRIDPSSNRITMETRIDSLAQVADGPDGLWGLIDPSAGKATKVSLAQLDPGTGKPLRTIDLAPAAVQHDHTPELDDALGSLWVVVADDRIARVNPASGAVMATIRTPSVPSGYVTLAFAGQRVYVGQSNTTVARIDAGTNCVDGVVYLGAQTAAGQTPGPQDSLFAGPEGVYAAFDLGALALIDPATMAVRQSVRLDSQDFIGAPASGFGSIWYPTFGNNTVLRVGPLA